MGATKEQERKALEKIATILEGLGSDSYLNMTFDGVLELAEENITNDTAWSWKDRARIAQEEAEAYHKAAKEIEKDARKAQEEAQKKIDDLEAQIKTLTGFHEAKAARIDELLKDQEDAVKIIGDYGDKISDLSIEAQRLRQEVIELKAKLYDLTMTQ